MIDRSAVLRCLSLGPPCDFSDRVVIEFQSGAVVVK